MFEMIMARLVNDQCTQGDMVQFTNLLLASLTEYHLTASVRPYSSVNPILPKEIDKRLPNITEYMPSEAEFTSSDVRLKDAKAAVLRLAAWLHRVWMYHATDQDTAQSQRHEDHQVGPLLQYFLAPGCVPVTSNKVIDRVLNENLKDAHSQLQECKAELRKLRDRLKDLQEVLDETRIEYSDVHCSRDSAKKDDLRARKKILKKDIKYCEAEIKAKEFSVHYCEAYLDGAYPAEAKRLASAEGGDDNVPEGEQAEGDQEPGRDTTTPQGQEGSHETPEVEGTKMETETQNEPQPSDHESEILTPRSEQSSIKSDEERMVGMEEVMATTGDMTLETPRDQEASSHPDEDPGTQDEPQC